MRRFLNWYRGRTINEREQELRNAAQGFAERMGATFNANLDLSVESLTELDGTLGQLIDLAEVYWSDNPEDLLPHALGITAYVGEVFRETIEGAAWVTEMEEGEIPPPHIRLSSGMRLNLMKKALEVLTRNDSPSFAEYYQTVIELARSHEPGGKG